LNDEPRPAEGEPNLVANSNPEPMPTKEPMAAMEPVDPAQPTQATRWSSVRAHDRNGRTTGANAGFVSGARIGGYVLLECIGQGGMARVYRAEHEGLQRQVALKVLLDPGSAVEGHERFLREARIAAAIKHRNVVNIFDVGVDRGTPYLAMELLEGADLDTFMGGKNRLDEATTMDIIIPIASALATVHDAGIVHRDLKPGNIFLARGRNDELEPRLLDFGISKSTTEQLRLTSTHGPVLGTPFYMSPEAAAGGEMTALSDQYALGVVLYECLAGTHPFAASNNFAEIVQRISSGNYKPISAQNPQLSKRMATIVERAMQLDPARRFRDMRAMGRELLVLAGQRTRVTWQLSFTELPASVAVAKSSVLNSTPPVPMVRRVRRRPRYVTPALLALLVVGTWQSLSYEPVRERLEPLRERSATWAALARERLDSIISDELTVEAVGGDLPMVKLALEPPPNVAVASSLSATSTDFPAAIALPDSDPALALAPPSPTPAEPSSVAAANGDAPAVSQAPRNTARSANARRSKTSKRVPEPAPVVPPAMQLGTNNAPILD
jgi:serine/threonine protein kinase